MDLNQQVAINDPWDQLDNPQVYSPEYWGLCSIDTYYAYVNKGELKVRFDSSVHPIEKRSLVVDIVITPLSVMNLSKPISRSLLEFEWSLIYHKILRPAGISGRELNGKYVFAKLVPTGKTYVKDGETRNSTRIELVKIFETEAQCLADYNTAHDIETTASTPPHPAIKNDKPPWSF